MQGGTWAPLPGSRVTRKVRASPPLLSRSPTRCTLCEQERRHDAEQIADALSSGPSRKPAQALSLSTGLRSIRSACPSAGEARAHPARSSEGGDIEFFH